MPKMMTIRWVDERPDLEEALNSQLPTAVEVSPCGLMLMGVFIDMMHKGGDGQFQHVVRQVEEYDFLTYALCGKSFFPSNVESITGLVDVNQLDSKTVCSKCSVEAEYLFYTKCDADV